LLFLGYIANVSEETLTSGTSV